MNFHKKMPMTYCYMKKQAAEMCAQVIAYLPKKKKKNVCIWVCVCVCVHVTGDMNHCFV